MGVGFGFGIADVKPIPVIILAQGINGVLLPLVTVFLLLAVNDPAIVPAGYRNGPLANGLMLLLVGTTTLLGLTNLTKAAAILSSSGMGSPGLIWWELAFSGLVALLRATWSGAGGKTSRRPFERKSESRGRETGGGTRGAACF
jgi:hypothetical protein